MNFGAMMEQFNIFAAFWLTVRLAFFGAIGALIIGTIVAILRVSPVPSLRFFGATYVSLIRNTPLTLILFFCIFALGFSMGIRLVPDGASLEAFNITWGVTAIAVYHASFVAEALRSGVNTVPQGQAEAARAIGLGFLPSLRHVILPQAFRGAIAPLGNVMIALTKNTTVAATVGLTEAAATMKSMIEFYPNLIYVTFAIVALGFVILTLPMGIFFTWLSRRLAVQR